MKKSFIFVALCTLPFADAKTTPTRTEAVKQADYHRQLAQMMSSAGTCGGHQMHKQNNPAGFAFAELYHLSHNFKGTYYAKSQ